MSSSNKSVSFFVAFGSLSPERTGLYILKRQLEWQQNQLGEVPNFDAANAYLDRTNALQFLHNTAALGNKLLGQYFIMFEITVSTTVWHELVSGKMPYDNDARCHRISSELWPFLCEHGRFQLEFVNIMKRTPIPTCRHQLPSTTVDIDTNPMSVVDGNGNMRQVSELLPSATPNA